MSTLRRQTRRLKATGWNAKAKALRFGDHLAVICFREGRWWHIDMTGARVGPISRREAYLTAASYMNAAEIASFGAEELQRENEADWAQQSRSLASTGRVPHFYASNERALEDIREQAALQTASPA